VIASGVVVGINNTLTTQAVMLVSPVERPVASAAYGFVRFIGGGLAPFFAGKMVEAWNIHVPFVVGAVAVVLGIAVLSTGHRMHSRADATMAASAPASDEEISGEVADEFGGASGAIDDELQAEHGRHAAPTRS
jgi:MFS family permease